MNMINTVFKENLFEGKVALISGGGTGIGFRTARELARLGATVILASRREEVLKKAVEKIQQEGGKAYSVPCNIREENSVKFCIEESVRIAGTIDYLVNNAGGQFSAFADKIKRKGWNAVIETNLTGTFFLSQEVFNQVFKEKGGAIVTVIANMWNGFPGMAHTGAARSGVDNLTKTLAIEWGRYGVRINAVAPGTINSSGLDNYPPEVKAMIHEIGKHNQTFRLGTEEETAASIIFLLSPAASYITGETLKVHGGGSIYSPNFPPHQPTKWPIFKDDECDE